MNPKDIDIVCFHSPCQDGTASAWVAFKYARENNLKYNFVPMSHSVDTKFEYEGKNVTFFDYAPKDELLKEIEIKAKDYYILDHHITNKDRLANCTKCIFDMDRSGVGLSWDYFYPGVEMPMFLQMIQDRDIWKFTIPETKAFCNGFYTYSGMRKTLEDRFALFDETFESQDKLNQILAIGDILEQQKISKVKKSADYISKKTYIYNGLKVGIVNCDPEIGSDLGNYIVSNYDYDFAVCWRYDQVNEEYNLSLRSRGDMDVSQICKGFGGGGHKHAGGCSSKIHPSILFNNSSD